MKSFIDSQIDLALDYVTELEGLKQCMFLLKISPNDTELLDLKSRCQMRCADILQDMVKKVLPGNDENVIDHGCVTIATEFFGDN